MIEGKICSKAVVFLSEHIPNLPIMTELWMFVACGEEGSIQRKPMPSLGAGRQYTTTASYDNLLNHFLQIMNSLWEIVLNYLVSMCEEYKRISGGKSHLLSLLQTSEVGCICIGNSDSSSGSKIFLMSCKNFNNLVFGVRSLKRWCALLLKSVRKKKSLKLFKVKPQSLAY